MLVRHWLLLVVPLALAGFGAYMCAMVPISWITILYNLFLSTLAGSGFSNLKSRLKPAERPAEASGTDHEKVLISLFSSPLVAH